MTFLVLESTLHVPYLICLFLSVSSASICIDGCLRLHPPPPPSLSLSISLSLPPSLPPSPPPSLSLSLFLSLCLWSRRTRGDSSLEAETCFPEGAVLDIFHRPPMGQLRNVQVSNAALLAMCNREKVPVVDNTDAFTARSGTPRKHLSSVQGPAASSDGGTSRHLQVATGASHRQARHHQPSSTETRPGTAPAATGKNPATPCSQTFPVGTCAARF